METPTRMLVIGSVWPEPQSSAAGAHLLQVLRPFLADGWEIHFAATATESPFAVDLPTLGIKPHTVRVNDSAFDSLLAEIAPEIVLFDRFFIEEQFGWRVEEMCPNAVRILNSEDLHSLREARRHPQSPPLPPARSPIARREIASILRSDLSLIISEHELDVLRQDFQIGPDLLHYAPFMLEPVDPESWPGFKDRRDFICIGNYRHAPNWDAVTWMSKEIWPRIHAALPDAQLRIAGAYATPEQLALHDPKRGLHVEGRIEDADEAFRRARVCLAPLRFGAGLKGKLFDAMRNGTPSVTTPVGAEGITGELPFGGIVADTASEIAKAALRLHEDEADWHRAQALGQSILAARFDREAHESALRNAVDAARRNLETRRDQNFVGAMLRDHHHKSTRYLSLWIEAKNKIGGEGVTTTPSRLPPRKNLLNSKWSATRPRDKEKHFLVTRVREPKPADQEAPQVELEALLTKRRFEISLEELGNPEVWKKGWS